MPASIHPALTFHGNEPLRPNKTPRAYLALELLTPRLNDVHQHLWLAGSLRAARPLHRQRLIGRSILITEDPDEHLVWYESQIFVKPLPEVLLDYDYWLANLCAEQDQDLYGSACGLLLSYAWLVRHKSDLDIAKECGLLARSVEWLDWVEFLDGFLDKIDLHKQANQRYRYGELRLSRLDMIYRLLPPTYSINIVVRGYGSRSSWYTKFFERHFKWMLVVFATLSVLLSALQVGLATRTLEDSTSFQRASFIFSLVSVLAVIGCTALVFVTSLALFWYHLLFTWWRKSATVKEGRESIAFP
jgi:hypothetical protein